MAEVKHLSVAEFRAAGYLQEVNRCFLHPLGLALSVDVDDGGTESFGAIWDCRSDPEGIVFGALGRSEVARGQRVQFQLEQKSAHRKKGLGFAIQPLVLPDGIA